MTAVPATSILDDFNRADEGPPLSVAQGWLSYGDLTGLKIVSNQCITTSTGNYTGRKQFWGTAFGPDCEVYIDLPSESSTSGLYANLFARVPTDSYLASAATDGYNLTITKAYMELKASGNGGGVLGQYPDPSEADTFVAGDSFLLRCVGDTISAYYKHSSGSWTLALEFTDTTYTAAGYIGVQITNYSLALDNFGGGDIVIGSASLSPSASASPSASISPSLSPSASASPSVSPSATELDLEQMTINAIFPQSSFQRISGTVGGNEVATYVRRVDRMGKICNPGQTARILVSPNFPYTIMPGMEAVLFEYGVKVITGYVVKVTHSRPSADWEIEIVDKFMRATNYFYAEERVTDGGHNTKYWIEKICSEIGLVSRISNLDTPMPIPAGIQIGLRTAAEVLTDIITYSSQYMYVDPDGFLQVGRIVSPNRRVLNQIVDVHDSISDEQTRTVIKVFGSAGGITPVPVRATFNVDTDGVNVDLTAAVGAPMVETQSEAQRMADYMGWELSPLTRHTIAKIPGVPLVTIGSVAAITYSHSGHDYSNGGPVTSLTSTLDENGYLMDVTVGERCPRIAGWSSYIPPILAGTVGDGVYRTDDQAANWYKYSEGLPQGIKKASHVAINFYTQAMAIINDNTLYYNGGGTWKETVLPPPIYPIAGGSPANTVITAIDAMGGKGQFAVLVVGNPDVGTATYSRTWVYTSSTGSGTDPLDWTSTPISRLDPSSGSTFYNVLGYDLSSRNGTVYVLAKSSWGGTSGSIPPGSGVGANGDPIAFSFYSFNKFNKTYPTRFIPVPDGRSGGDANTFFSTPITKYYPDDYTWRGELNASYEVDCVVHNLPENTKGHSGRLDVYVSGISDYTATPDGFPLPDNGYVFKPNIRLAAAGNVEIGDHSIAYSNTGAHPGWDIDFENTVYAQLVSNPSILPASDNWASFGMIYTPKGWNNAGYPVNGSAEFTTWDMSAAITQVTWTDTTSGSVYTIPPATSGSTTIDILAVSGDFTSVVATIDSSSGSGNVGAGSRLKEGSDGSMFVYGRDAQLLFLNSSGSAFTDIYPSTLSSTDVVIGVERIPNERFYGDTSGSYTGIVMKNFSDYTASQIYYHYLPEEKTGWVHSLAGLDDNTYASDLIWSNKYLNNDALISISNNLSVEFYGIQERVFKGGIGGTFASSSVGFPYDSGAPVLDLDVAD